MLTDSWDEPAGIAPRGTVIVAAGRGETTDAYGRFGRRIAADGYRVRALGDITADIEASLAAAGKLLVDDSLPGPKVVIGSDTGALFALTLAARRAPGLDALILAGLPLTETTPAATPPPATDAKPSATPATAPETATTTQTTPAARAEPGAALVAGAGPAIVRLPDWDAELEARSGCPAHRGVLSNGAVTPGALFSTQIPTVLIGDTGIGSTVPTLGLHGDADPVSPLETVRDRYPGTLVSIVGGRHDVLNDVTHRTVAATIVLFLERLRLGGDLPEIARVARSVKPEIDHPGGDIGLPAGLHHTETPQNAAAPTRPHTTETPQTITAQTSPYLTKTPQNTTAQTQPHATEMPHTATAPTRPHTTEAPQNATTPTRPHTTETPHTATGSARPQRAVGDRAPAGSVDDAEVAVTQPGRVDTALPDAVDAAVDSRRSVLVEADELYRRLAEPDAPVLLDVRWALGDPHGAEHYRAGHIPGAVYVDLDTELAGPLTPGAGRHPLPEVEALQESARAWGVTRGNGVVVYDNSGGLAAARAWWLLRWAGVASVRILDGGLGAWAAAGYGQATGAARPRPGSDIVLSGGHLPTLTADEAAALPAIGALLDARAGERYRGEVEPIDPRAGHIPGAVSAPTVENLAGSAFRSTAELRERFGGLGAGPVGVYCGSGVTAAHEIAALAIAGIDAALYPGSWSAWSADPSRPIETGRLADPNHPTETSKPTEPNHPIKTGRLADPIRPTGTGEPADPAIPGDVRHESGKAAG